MLCGNAAHWSEMWKIQTGRSFITYREWRNWDAFQIVLIISAIILAKPWQRNPEFELQDNICLYNHTLGRWRAYVAPIQHANLQHIDLNTLSSAKGESKLPRTVNHVHSLVLEQSNLCHFLSFLCRTPKLKVACCCSYVLASNWCWTAMYITHRNYVTHGLARMTAAQKWLHFVLRKSGCIWMVTPQIVENINIITRDGCVCVCVLH